MHEQLPEQGILPSQFFITTGPIRPEVELWVAVIGQAIVEALSPHRGVVAADEGTRRTCYRCKAWQWLTGTAEEYVVPFPAIAPEVGLEPAAVITALRARLHGPMEHPREGAPVYAVRTTAGSMLATLGRGSNTRRRGRVGALGQPAMGKARYR